MSMRAAQHCDALTMASGFGWWLFSPVDFLLLWDGTSIVWSQDGKEWEPVDDQASFPNCLATFNARAPSHLNGTAPAFLTALPEPGLIQVSLGILARTGPGWSMLIRRPPNLPFATHIEHFEGIVDTSRWLGPLFINLRLTKTDVPIHIHADRPLVQAQPIPQALLMPKVLQFEVIDTIGPDEWEAYCLAVVEPNTRPDRALGAYAITQRRSRKMGESRICPVHANVVE